MRQIFIVFWQRGEKDSPAAALTYQPEYPQWESVFMFSSGKFRNAQQQSLGVFMLRVVKDLLGSAVLNNLAGVHHGYFLHMLATTPKS